MIKSGRPPKGKELLSRDRILDSGLKLFLEHGYGNLNMEMIAKDAHVSMRTIYSYFEGKSGLFGAVIKRCSDQFVDSLSEHIDTEKALITFGKEFIYRVTRPDAVRIRTILIGESLRFPDLAPQFYAQGPQLTLDKLAEFFQKKQQQGYFTNLDTNRLANHFFSCLRSERFHKLQLGLEPTPNEAEVDVWVNEAVNFFLYGYTAATLGTSTEGDFIQPIGEAIL